MDLRSVKKSEQNGGTTPFAISRCENIRQILGPLTLQGTSDGIDSWPKTFDFFRRARLSGRGSRFEYAKNSAFMGAHFSLTEKHPSLFFRAKKFLTGQPGIL